MTTAPGPRSVAVIGAGAIGGVLAAILSSEASHRVQVCLRPGGQPPSKLELRRPDGSTVETTPKFNTDPAGVAPVDVVLLTTKAYDSAADRRDRRPLEWEARNAVVGRLGRRHGIATPINDLVTALLRAARPDPG